MCPPKGRHKRTSNQRHELHRQIARSCSRSRKIQCNDFQRAVQEHVTEFEFWASQALPLVWTRFLRLAKSSPKTARSPARRSRDGREPSGKTTGAISAQRPGNGRAVAAALPPSIRKDESQDNLPCSRLGRAMSAPEAGETTPSNLNHDIQKL